MVQRHAVDVASIAVVRVFKPGGDAARADDHPSPEESEEMVGFLPLRDANLRRVAAQRLVHLLRQERARALLVRGAVAALPKVDDVALAAVVGVAKHV